LYPKKGIISNLARQLKRRREEALKGWLLAQNISKVDVKYVPWIDE